MSDSLIAFQPAIEEPSNITPSAKELFIGGRGHAGRVLPLAARIGETEVHELDVLFLDQRENLFGIHLSCVPLLVVYCCLCPQRPGPHTAASPRSPVRIRIASSMLETKILPSPMRPVCAELRIASTAFSTISSSMMSSSFTFGQKVDDVLGAAIELGMALLPAEAFGFEHRDALQADLVEGVLHLIQLEGLDDRFDLLHLA